MPRIAYAPSDWAEQLQSFLQTVVQKPYESTIEFVAAIAPFINEVS